MSHHRSRSQMASAALRRRHRPARRRRHAEERDRDRPARAVVHLCGPARRRQDDDGAHSGARAQLRDRGRRPSRAASATRASKSPKAATSTSSRSTAPPTPASTPSARSSSSRSSIAPMRDRYKIFIIDEVHRLSKSAFDALLKSIEEPPPYVKFMMATTELHAVPATIQSRSQVFELKTLPFASIRDQLEGGDDAREGQDRRRGAGARGAVGRRQHARRAVGARSGARVHERRASRPPTSAPCSASSAATCSSRSRRPSRARTPPPSFALAGTVVEAGFDLRIVCRELARLDARPAGRADRSDARQPIRRSPPKASAIG